MGLYSGGLIFGGAYIREDKCVTSSWGGLIFGSLNVLQVLEVGLYSGDSKKDRQIGRQCDRQARRQMVFVTS